jgi:2-furoyl-CoA dehydrogenase FAD binding subunit
VGAGPEGTVKPASFDYVRPESVEEAVALLAEHGDEAKVLAGGQSLVPLLNMRLARPSVLVDINRLPLDSIEERNGRLAVGATVRQSAPELGRIPLLSECLPYVGHFVTRNRGTIGGSIAHADASAELPLVLFVLGGSVVAQSSRGRRTIAAPDFFVTHYTTSLEPDELVVETTWPRPEPGWGHAFEELAQRRGDYALCMVAACVRGNDVRVGIGSVVDRPTLLEVDPEHPGESAAAQVEPADGLHGSARYLRALVRVLTERAVKRART